MSALPCIHCGELPTVEKNLDLPDADPYIWEAYCKPCHDPRYGHESGVDEADAIDRWNCQQRWEEEDLVFDDESEPDTQREEARAEGRRQRGIERGRRQRL